MLHNHIREIIAKNVAHLNILYVYEYWPIDWYWNFSQYQYWHWPQKSSIGLWLQMQNICNRVYFLCYWRERFKLFQSFSLTLFLSLCKCVISAFFLFRIKNNSLGLSRYQTVLIKWSYTQTAVHHLSLLSLQLNCGLLLESITLFAERQCRGHQESSQMWGYRQQNTTTLLLGRVSL